MKKTIRLPKKYIPKHLTDEDREKWAKQIQKTNSSYKKGVYKTRKNVKSYKHKVSPHVKKALKIYNLAKITSGNTKKTRFKELSKKTKCSVKSLNKIYAKGSAAWFSGSRPNQTQSSWGVARVASAVSGGKSSYIDRHELMDGCKKNSLALRLMRKNKVRKTQKRNVRV